MYALEKSINIVDTIFYIVVVPLGDGLAGRRRGDSGVGSFSRPRRCVCTAYECSSLTASSAFSLFFLPVLWSAPAWWRTFSLASSLTRRAHKLAGELRLCFILLGVFVYLGDDAGP
jgi:hypothetical protein